MSVRLRPPHPFRISGKPCLCHYARKEDCKTTSTTAAVSSSSFASVITALQGQISVSTVVEVLAYAAGISIALVFLWWGVRKATQMIMSAFRSGSISI